MLVSLTIHFMFTSSNLIFLGPQVVAAAVAFFKFISGLLLEQSQVSDGENNDATQKKAEHAQKVQKVSSLPSDSLIDVPLYFDDDLSSSHTDLSSCLAGATAGIVCRRLAMLTQFETRCE